MAAHMESLDKVLFVIPAFAAICFDFLICSYSFSIKRIGHYCREYIEPALKAEGCFPHDFVLWQEFLRDHRTRQNLSLYGNIGLTALAVAIGGVALFIPYRPTLSFSLLTVLLGFVIIDVLVYLSPQRFRKLRLRQDKSL